MTEDLIKLQRKIQNKLPHHIKTIWKEYLTFCQIPPPEDTKQFSAYQQACKYALGHLLLLLKIAGVSTQKTDLLPEETDWITAAHTALAQLEGTEDDS